MNHLHSDQHLNSVRIAQMKEIIIVLLNKVGGRVDISRKEQLEARRKAFFIDTNLRNKDIRVQLESEYVPPRFIKAIGE